MKSLETAQHADERFQIFMEPDVNGGLQRATFAGHYALVALAALPPYPDKLVARLYERAQHCFLYAWFDYEMMLLAEGQAFAALEAGLRLRLGKSPDYIGGLRKLLKEAVSAKLIAPPPPKPLSAPDDWPSLHDMLVTLRNDILHGSAQVHDLNMTYIVFDHIRALICELHGLTPPPAPVETFGPTWKLNGKTVC